MSTTIDERVVEMRFDNRQFEQNVSQTMSTLDKFKKLLHFDGASKGLENVNAAAKNVNMTGLGASVEQVSMKFSALQVMGVTALANITNSAVNAGKRIVSALTIDPIKTGFQEYETQINAVQTILANTESKGTTIDDVNLALEELNKYADKTIYNFTEMTRNIGTFTAAGVDLDTSVSAIQGIANLAAVSGSTSQQASTAMYQLSQALASGTVKLQDWNSVVNAGMGGEVFQNALVRTAAVMAGASEDVEAWRAANIDSYGSFRDSLTQGGWLTTEVLTETLNQFTLATDGSKEKWEEYKKSLMDTGYTEKQAEEILKMANTATDAATKVKTFTQLWDVLKESAQSGWSQTWKLIIGDFEEAKSLLTPLADFLTGFINRMSDFRNNILESALGRGFSKLGEGITDVLKPATKAADAIKGTVETITDLGAVVDDVILGKFGNGEERFNALTEAGINYYEVQNKVNEKLNNGKRYTQEQIDAQNKLLGVQGKSAESSEKKAESIEKEAEATVKLNDEQKKQLKKLGKMNEAQLRSAGYSDKQIEALTELKKTAEDLGIPFDTFIDQLEDINGRWLLMNSFKNIGQGLVDTFSVIGAAWRDIFPEATVENFADSLFNAIAAFHKFTSGIAGAIFNGEELTKTGEKLYRTFSGIFAAIDLVSTVVGGVFKIVFKIAVAVLDRMGMSFLDVTAFIGDALVGIHSFVEGILNISGVVDFLVPLITNLVGFIKQLINSVKNSKWFGDFCTYLKDAADGLGNLFKNLPDSTAFQNLMAVIKKCSNSLGSWINTIRNAGGISGDIIMGLIKGVIGGIPDVISAVFELAKSIITGICDVLGIHSPATTMIAIGGFIIAGLILGLTGGEGDLFGAVEGMAGGIFEKLKNAIGDIIDWIKNLDFGAIFTAIVSIGAVFAMVKIGQALSSFASAFEGFGDLLENANIAVKSFSKVLNATAFNIRMEGIKTLVESLLMLIGAIIVLTFFDPKKLLTAAGIITAIALVLVGLAWAMNKIGGATASIDWKNGLNIKGLTSGLASIGIAILLIAIAVKALGSLDPNQATDGLKRLAIIITMFAGLFVVIGLLVKGKAAQNIDKFGAMLAKMAIALLLIAAVVKIVSKLEWEEMGKGAAFLGGFLVFVAILSTIAMIPAKGISKIGKMMLSISLSLLMMIAVVKLASKLTIEEVTRGVDFLLAFTVFVGILAFIGGLGGKGIDGVGKMMLGISISMLLMIAVMKLVATMQPEDLAKGLVAIVIFTGIITHLVKTLSKAGANLPKVALTLIAFSVSIGILAIVTAALGLIKLTDLLKGVAIVGVLSIMMAGMIMATRGANDVTGNIVALTVAIGVMVAAVALLTLIDPVKLGIAVAALSVLIGMFTLMTKVAGMAGKAMGTIIALTVAIAAIGTILILLARLPVESVIASAASLAGLMLVLTGILYLLVPIGAVTTQAIKGVLALTALAVPLLAFVGILALMQNVQNATNNALALSAFVAVLSVALLPLTLVGAFAPAAILGVVALTTLAVPLLAFVGILALMQNVQNAETNAKTLGTLLKTLSDVLIVLALVGPAALIGTVAINALITTIGAFAILATAIGALITYFPELEQFVDSGIDIFKKLASGIGAIIGSFISGFAGEVMSILPALGLSLSQFMVNAMPFIMGAKLVDDTVLKGVGILTAAIIALTAAELLAGLVEFLPFTSSFAELGTQLSLFMTNAIPFIMGASMLTEEMTTGVKNLAEAILILTAANVIDGLTSLLGGGNALENFATQLPILGTGLRGFVDSVGTFSEDQLTTVTCAANAIKTLASAAAEIPNTGGLLADLVGENELGPFAEQFPTLGTGLRGFLDNIGTFTDEQMTTVTCAANAVKALAAASNEIPNMGGLLAQLIGDNGLDTFAEQFPALGTGLRGFLDNIGTFTDEQVGTVTCAANAVKALADAASGIDGQAEWAKKLFGDNSLSSFATQFGDLGTSLSSFVTNLGTFTEAQVSTTNAAVRAIKAFAELADTDLKGAKKNLEGFGDKLGEFGEDLGTFCEDMPSAESVDSAVTGLRNILSAIDEVAAANTGSLAELADNLKKVGDKAVDKFVSAFTSSTAKTDVKDAADALADKAVDGLDGLDDDAEPKGKDLGSGLVRGIESKYQAAYDAGYKLGQKAVQGEKDGQKSNSPSKLTIQAGKWFGEGLVIGIEKMGDSVYAAGHDLGDTAVKSLSSTVSRIATAIDSDMDVQPTIRPVLDLSDIRSGAGAISGMLGTGASVGVMANVGAISSAMNRRSQNVTNADVVSAIERLDKHLDNVGNTTYSIAGVTYDDGSNVASAVKEITRYARMERRV